MTSAATLSLLWLCARQSERAPSATFREFFIIEIEAPRAH